MNILIYNLISPYRDYCSSLLSGLLTCADLSRSQQGVIFIQTSHMSHVEVFAWGRQHKNVDSVTWTCTGFCNNSTDVTRQIQLQFKKIYYIKKRSPCWRNTIMAKNQQPISQWAETINQYNLKLWTFYPHRALCVQYSLLYNIFWRWSTVCVGRRRCSRLPQSSFPTGINHPHPIIIKSAGSITWFYHGAGKRSFFQRFLQWIRLRFHLGFNRACPLN